MCKIRSVLALDRGSVRRRLDERFSAGRMPHDYFKNLPKPCPVSEHGFATSFDIEGRYGHGRNRSLISGSDSRRYRWTTEKLHSIGQELWDP
jgi:hypothetical protein